MQKKARELYGEYINKCEMGGWKYNKVVWKDMRCCCKDFLMRETYGNHINKSHTRQDVSCPCSWICCLNNKSILNYFISVRIKRSKPLFYVLYWTQCFVLFHSVTPNLFWRWKFPNMLSCSTTTAYISQYPVITALFRPNSIVEAYITSILTETYGDFDEENQDMLNCLLLLIATILRAEFLKIRQTQDIHI